MKSKIVDDSALRNLIRAPTLIEIGFFLLVDWFPNDKSKKNVVHFFFFSVFSGCSWLYAMNNPSAQQLVDGGEKGLKGELWAERSMDGEADVDKRCALSISLTPSRIFEAEEVIGRKPIRFF